MESKVNKNANRLYLILKEIGILNDNDEKVFSIGYNGKMIAPTDRPMEVIIKLFEEILPMMDYSSKEYASQDLQKLKNYINSFEMK